MLTQERLKQLFLFDPVTGVFSRHNPSRYPIVGTVGKIGYRYISIDNRRYLAHRLAWLYHYGAFPKKEIDHINRLRDDNRICNLREVTRSQNSINTPVRPNSLIKEKNIKFDKRDGSYTVLFIRDGRSISCGRFYNLTDAVERRNFCAASY